MCFSVLVMLLRFEVHYAHIHYNQEECSPFTDTSKALLLVLKVYIIESIATIPNPYTYCINMIVILILVCLNH